MSARILVLAEWVDGEQTRLTGEALGCARELADRTGGEVVALYRDGDGPADALFARGADEVLAVALAPDTDWDVEARAAALARAAGERPPAVVLIGHTPLGADVAPRLAFRLESVVAMGCLKIADEGGKWLFTRARQGGIAHEVLSFTTAPVVATLRAGWHDVPHEARRNGRTTRMECADIVARTRVIERRRDKRTGELQLEDAKVIVAGGRGLEGAEGFRALRELADTLGAAVGASRVPCDLGWCPRSWQIGLTGRTVTPDLYIAVGISGASHHLAGCGNAKTIVAINTDANAAIFREARYGIVGDYRQVVPALVAALKDSAA